ncbi:hypothetical protein [Sphingomonas jatrophae]|uniref:Uncharacterized protein n=1 Tax=Sphingomonas jatrophae TaxID=1166337 RepID=A0A1I6M2A7_9SPHN|nr:hypothetical protein [Sphingomonas jatrophae]SFS09849.1 hypothetical protein SAMN05192580_3335 [Sphingomonas jatrophae]
MSADDETGVPSEAFRQAEDVCIIYSFEDVAFRWDHATGRVFRRFRDTGRESETDSANRLFGDAQTGGRLATREEYDAY